MSKTRRSQTLAQGLAILSLALASACGQTSGNSSTPDSGVPGGSGGRTDVGGASGAGGEDVMPATGGSPGIAGIQGTGGSQASGGGGGATAGTGGRSTTGGASTATGGRTAGTGGRTGMGGASSGSGGTTAAVQRPSYNTGSGFFVLNGKLYDPAGAEFRIRGMDRNHFDFAAPGIPKTHANTERTVFFFAGEYGSSTDRNLQVMQQEMITNHIVPMPGNWEGTCDESTSTLNTIVQEWVNQASSYTALDKYMILNIANEWGPSDSTTWRDAYISAVQRLRTAGYTCTISVTSGGCGQDNPDLVKHAQAVFDADPQKNVIFDQHIYGNWGYDAAKESWQQGLTAGLDALAATGLVMIIGEFGPGNDIGPSPTNITPKDLIQAAEARNLGWMAWAWDDNPSAGDASFALSLTGDYKSSADLTTFGKSVIEGAGYGLLSLAKYQTAF